MRMRAGVLVWAVGVACGGGQGASATAPTQSAAVASLPSESAAPVSESPQSIGTKHKKVGDGWFLSGSGKEFYDAIYEPGANPVVVMKQQADPHGRWATLMKNVSAAPYVGKKIRVRIGVKSVGVTGRGEVWARAAAPHAAEDAPSVTTKVDQASEMKPYEVIVDVKDGTRVVEYGVSLAGEGQVWVGRDAIDVLP